MSKRDPIEESRRLYRAGRWQYADTGSPLDLGPLGYFAVSTMRAYLRGERVESFLDVGGGEGTVGRMVTRGKCQAILDPVIESLQVARGYCSQAVGGDGRKLPFADDTFDMVLLNDVLEHIPQRDVPLMLREAYRVLRPGGISIIHTSAFGIYMRRWLRPGPPGRIDADDVTDGHLNRMEKYELLQYIAGAGFKTEKFVFYKHFFQPLSDLPIRVFKAIGRILRGERSDYSDIRTKVNKNRFVRFFNRVRCWIPFLDALIWGKWAGGAVVIKVRKPFGKNVQ